MYFEIKTMKRISFLFTILIIIFASCSQNDPLAPAQNSPAVISITSPPQLSATINNSAYSMVGGTTSYSSGSTSNRNVGGGSNTYNSATYQSNVVSATANQPFLGIWKGTIQFPLSSNTPDSASFDAFFGLQSYPYSVNYTNGIEVDWIDPNGNLYTTSQGTGVQTGSIFTIVAKQASFTNGYYEVKIVATFNCTLYNSTGGNIPLTNGIFVGYYQND